MARFKARPRPPGQALDTESAFRALWPIANDIPNPTRFVFGTARTVLSRVGNATIETAAAFARFQRAGKFFFNSRVKSSSK